MKIIKQPLGESKKVNRLLLCLISALLVVVVVAVVLFNGKAAQMSDAAIISDLQAEMDELVAKDQFSGVVLLAKNGKPLFEKAYGYADQASDVKNNVDTKFYTASMAKLFTATAILQLAEGGKLSLDDTLSKVLPDYPNKEIADRIIIRQLLMHTSGMGDYVGTEMAQTDRSKLQSISDYLPFFVNKPLLFEPGTQYQYSNAGMLVLGLVIEHLSGEKFENYVNDHIFKTAGMESSGYWNSTDDVSNRALGYTMMGVASGEQRKVQPLIGRGAGPAGGSGVYVTAGDMLRFGQAVKEGKLLTPEYTDMLLKYNPTDAKHLYGWGQDYVNGIHSTGHSGSFMGASTEFTLYPDLGYTVVVLSNYDGAARSVESRLKARLTGQEVPKSVSLSAEQLKQFEGEYEEALQSGNSGGKTRMGQGGSTQTDDPGNGPVRIEGPGGNSSQGVERSSIKVVADNGALLVTTRSGAVSRFIPYEADRFYDADGLIGRLAFTRNKDGEVTGFTMTNVTPEEMKATKKSLSDGDKAVSVDRLIDSIDKALCENYVFPDKGRDIGNYLKDQLKKGVYKDINNPRLLAQKIDSDMQSVQKDGHLRAIYQSPSGDGPRLMMGPPKDKDELLKWGKERNYELKKAEVLDGNIGYLKFDGFFGPGYDVSKEEAKSIIEQAKPVFSAAFNSLLKTDALIIDLRENHGGSPEMVKQIASYLFQQRTRLNDIYSPKTNETIEGWADPAQADNMKLSMPVFILTSNKTFSAAEGFSYALQATKRATIIGESTGGGAHPATQFDMGQGFLVLIPRALSVNDITKTNWEGTGVIPDVQVPADQALQKAIELIKK